MHLPVITAIYASLLGVTLGRVVPRDRRRTRWVAGAAIALAPLLVCAWNLFAEPPIFVYDHLWGCFAGSLYDEAIAVTGTLTTFRTMTLLRCATLVAFVWVWDRRPWLRLRVPIMAALAVLATVAADPLFGAAHDYRIDRDDIESELSVRVERPGLVIHLPAGTSEEVAEAAATDQAFRLAQLRKRLAPAEGDAPIHSYVYRDARQKARLMGGQNTQVAKPWLREIHIHDVKAPHPVLAHELVHVLARDFGSPLLGSSFGGELGLGLNLGLVEGLAAALTLRDGPLDLHAYAKAMRDAELAPDVRHIIGSVGSWLRAPRRAYTVAGSLVRHLIETGGVDRMKRVYATGDFAGVYGETLDTLVFQWEERIDALEILPRDRREANERYRTPSIFTRPCAHVIASLRARTKE